MLSGIETTSYLRLPGVSRLDNLNTPFSEANMRLTVFADSPHRAASSFTR
jgi:hypothetical protein